MTEEESLNRFANPDAGAVRLGEVGSLGDNPNPSGARVRVTRKRNWVFTLNNYVDGDIDRLKNISCKYVVLGEEVGDSGTKHIQGAIFYNTLKTFNQVKKDLGNNVHIEMMKGTPEQATEYCKKDGKYHEKGTPLMSQKEKGQAEKDRWEEALKQAKETGEVEDAQLQIKYARTFFWLNQRHNRKRKFEQVDSEHLWLWGKTGTGKTRYVMDNYPDHYEKMLNKWWDDYEDQEVVMIDELSLEHEAWMGPFLKRWSDRYAFTGEVKGGKLRLRPKLIIVTSNYSIRDIFKDPGVYEPLERRFKMIEFKKLEDFDLN